MAYFFEGIEELAAPDEPGVGGTRMNIELVRNFALIADSPVRSALLGLIRDLARRDR